MKKMCSLFLILMVFLVSLPASAEMKKLGQAGMTFLGIGGSARAAGMADVFGFAKNDLGSVFYNPAGLATVENRAFYFNYTDWIADMSVSNIAVSFDANQYGVFALNATVMDYGDIDGTSISESDPRGYADVEVGDVGGLAVGLAYGIQMTDKFSIGGGVKYVRQQLGQNDTYIGGVIEETGKENSVGTVAYDFGTMYDTGIKSIRLTMAIRNYAAQQLFENEEFQLPQTYKIGVSANMFEFLPWGSAEENSLILAVEGVDPHDRPEYVNAGLEYSLANLIDLRAGYAFQRADDDAGGFSAGAGLKLDNIGFNGRLDVAYGSMGSVLSNVMRVSFTGSF